MGGSGLFFGGRMTDPRGKVWSDAEVTWLLANYVKCGPNVGARHLRRSPLAIRIKAHRMGLRRDAPSPLTISEIVSRLDVSLQARGAGA